MQKFKRFAAVFILLLLCGCTQKAPAAPIAATTGPVAQFAEAITEGTGLTVSQVVTDSVSCLHDYSLSVGQMEAIAGSEVTIISGSGLEETMEDALSAAPAVIDCAAAVTPTDDPHYWLSPAEAAKMVIAIRDGLCELYPEHEALMHTNADAYLEKLADLQAYGDQELTNLSCRKLITFHDGFGWLAKAFDLEILATADITPDSVVVTFKEDGTGTWVEGGITNAFSYSSSLIAIDGTDLRLPYLAAPGKIVVDIGTAIYVLALDSLVA